MKIKLVFISLLIFTGLSAQKASDGEKFFDSKQYRKAQAVYESLLKKRPNDALYNYRLARCYYELKSVNKAIEHFEKSGFRYVLRQLYLGELYFENYQFEESIKAYQAFMATLKPDDSRIPELESKIAVSEKASRLLKRVEDIAIVDSVVVAKSEFLRFYNFSPELGSLKQERLKTDSLHTMDKITYTTQRQARTYFSDVVGGNADLFTTFKLFDEWSKPASVSAEINTKANENYPFLLLDGITLYFASDGDKSIGGYDIMVTRFMSGTNSFLNPENIGMPFNSPANDYMMVIDEQRKLGWFATDRNQPKGKVCIYTFVSTDIKAYVRNEDEAVVRNAARLLTYKKATKNKTTQVSVRISPVDELEKQIEFVINDSVIYNSINEFKSEEAAKLWMEFHALETEAENSTSILKDLREKYSQASDEERNQMSASILELEKKQIEWNKLMLSKALEVRTIENKYLLKE